jgi:serine/threonine-protein kinase HipA
MRERKAEVFYNDKRVGVLSKIGEVYYFKYSDEYMRDVNNPAISLSLPKTDKVFVSDFLFPFFFGLLAEGENRKLQCRYLRIDENDDFTRLIKTACDDTIGGVLVKEL